MKSLNYNYIRHIDSLFIFLFIALSVSSLYTNDWFRPTVFLAIIYFYFGVRILIHFRPMLSYSYMSISVTLIVAFSFLSLLWSIDISTTFREASTLFICTAIAMYIVHTRTLLQMLQIAFLSGVLMALLSLVFALFIPSIGVDVDFGIAWKGIYASKNSLALGMSMYIFLNIFLLFLIKKPSEVITVLLTIIVQYILIVLSTSTTGLVVSALGFLFAITLLLMHSLRHYLFNRTVHTCLLITAFVGILVSSFFISPFVQMFGKDMTFTSRTDIWAASIELIKQQPLLGYGFNSFLAESSWTKAYLDWKLTWPLSGGTHNGFIDLWLSLGIIGVLLLFISLIQFIRRSFILIVQNQDYLFLINLCFVLYVLVVNFQESVLLRPNYFLWSFYVFFYQKAKQLCR